MENSWKEKGLTGYPSIDKPWLKYYDQNAVQYISDTITQNAYHYMVESNKQHHHYIAIEYFGVKITYGELYDKIEKVAKALKANRISKGDYVTICLPNIPEIIYFAYAINRIGAGDKGHINENGCVYIVDRYKRVMLRSDGHTVHASMIENVIMEHDLVEICAAVGIHFEKNAGVIPTAFIKLKDTDLEKTKIIDEIDDLCSKKIPERDKAHVYVIVDNFPYTLMGKIDYRTLEQHSFSELDCIVKDYSFIKQ